YRRFKVKTVVGADDFATMAEIMRRRFKNHGSPVESGKPKGESDEDELLLGPEHLNRLPGGVASEDNRESRIVNRESGLWELPDLVIIDGGKGQRGAGGPGQT